MTTVKDAAKPETAQGLLYAAVEAAEAFGRRLLVAHGLSEQDAAIMAGCLVRGDLRGVDTHGLQFLPQYLDRVRRGLVNPKPNLVVERVTPVAGSLDGDNGYGFVVATKAMAAAMDMAKEFGIGVVSARRSTHFGMAACYTLQALEAGYISFVFTNASRAMPPWGRARGLSRNEPICRRGAVRQGTTVRPRHVAGGGRAGKNKTRGAARPKDTDWLRIRRAGPSDRGSECGA